MQRLGIWLIAIAVVFNGAAPFAPAMEQAAIVQGHDHAVGNHAAGAADHGAFAASTDHGRQHDHAHNKCCMLCNIASVLPGVTAVPMTFSYATVSFRMARHNLVGHLVALDPDIPKSLV